jgi:hypothetical protein
MNGSLNVFVLFSDYNPMIQSKTFNCQGNYLRIAHVDETLCKELTNHQVSFPSHELSMQSAQSPLIITRKPVMFINAYRMVPYPSGKGKVCKTLMHRFESDWHLLKEPLRSSGSFSVLR